MNANVRRTALSVVAATTTATVAAVVAFAGVGAAESGAPRQNVRTGDSARATTAQGTLVGAGQFASPTGGDRRNALKLAPYTTAIGAVVTPNSSMDAYLTAALFDVHATWARLFTKWNYKRPSVRYVWPAPNASESGRCGTSTNDTFQYCPSDDTITISQEGARQLWNGFRSIGNLQNPGTGDMSVALLVAHEYGHNVTQELGWLDRISPAAAERGADCLAGVWAKDAAQRGILERGDLNEALSALDLFAEHPEFGISDNGIHGSPAERQRAMWVGYKQGAAGCVNTYFQ